VGGSVGHEIGVELSERLLDLVPIRSSEALLVS
jgi:hypothetical protein